MASTTPDTPTPSSNTGKAMVYRLNALLRKCGEADNPWAQDLVQILCNNISTKRAYEDALATPELATTFAGKLGLTPSQTDLLLKLQAAKDIFVPNKWLDAVLTLAFAAECAYVAAALYDRGILVAFVAALFICDAVIHRIKRASASLGLYLSRRVKELGLVDSEPLAGRIQLKKWTEQSWQLFVHVAAASLSGHILSVEPWYDNPATVWIPHPYEQRGHFRADLEVFYIAQLAIWIYTCIIHRFFDERRKDYFVMYLHHIVTIALVGCSWAAGYLRIGLLVLWVHDVSDIFVDLLKMVNYLKLEGPRGFFASEVAYVSCVSAWVYWRLYQYPFRVIRGSFVESYRLLAKFPRGNDGPFGLFPPDLPLYSELNALLFCLLFLHIYWFHLFIMIGYRILTESAREASRQEYEGDSDGEETGGDDAPPALAASEDGANVKAALVGAGAAATPQAPSHVGRPSRHQNGRPH